MGLGLALANPSGVFAASEPTRDPEDILGEIVAEATSDKQPPLRLPRVAVELDGSGREAEIAREIIARDLQLSGEFDVVEAPAKEEGEEAIVRYTRARVEAVIHVGAERLQRGLLRLAVRLSTPDPDPTKGPRFEASLQGPLSRIRPTSHQLADRLIGAYTGRRGAFFGQLAFVVTKNGNRTVHVIDPDGHNLRPVSPQGAVALSPSFGPDGELYYAASFNHGTYKLFRAGAEPALPVYPPGSIYGIAFTGDRTRVALAIAQGAGVGIWSGPANLEGLERVSKVELAVHPTFSPTGKVAYAGASDDGVQRVYVQDKAVSPAGLPASSPTFCEHPEGIRLVYAVGVRQRSDLIAADTNGKNALRITQGQGRNVSPTCSPDGRLIAFFSTRRTGDGPGLYLVRLDGRRPPIKISSVVGDSLTWSRLPEPKPIENAPRPPTGFVAEPKEPPDVVPEPPLSKPAPSKK